MTFEHERRIQRFERPAAVGEQWAADGGFQRMDRFVDRHARQRQGFGGSCQMAFAHEYEKDLELAQGDLVAAHTYSLKLPMFDVNETNDRFIEPPRSAF
ncbi:hypothetical protein SSPSH_001558 [Salinisphaera shabanensis E1L3A]|uniref:Uncharacterized protein n=1 Tax=Salinisphaera shabanensis E1L3A TaxID=1033802 RepID=U2ENT5_9GAMM|nr:hypothetical protein [Salinisphaera shabanensis]ERJ19490.1 hypothetical protein SSPSH_001558 [Salinisphaera shabanensis E1L3A]